MDYTFEGERVICETTVPYAALIVGSGAAAYNCANRLIGEGVTNIALVTEGRKMGTSRNTGSDKQTYYKVACAGDVSDSPYEMAQTLFAGGSMDGDLALVEAAHSLASFFNLVNAGVPFPFNTFGEYVGYKTDHDPRERASSIGPYTSRVMTEVLEREAERRGVCVIDGMRVVKLLRAEGAGRVFGVIALDHTNAFHVIHAANVIFATGGPAGIYANTVYPPSQFGAQGMLAREGVRMVNVTEWQYGIGSTSFRWNLSGSYQQVIPRYVSCDKDGVTREFLPDYFATSEALFFATFKKGYEWPFDPMKTEGGGSSRIDIAIYIERHVKGRDVFLDFRENPHGREGEEFTLAALPELARDYITKSNAEGATPVERLRKMNRKAYDLYASHGIDLACDVLPIDVLPQHHNGGVAVNIWWETSCPHLFAIGECAGTHGVHRPGGSALNAGQVGGLRAAHYIARTRTAWEADGFNYEAETTHALALFEEDVTGKDAKTVTRDALTLLHARMREGANTHLAFIRNARSTEAMHAILEECEAKMINATPAKEARADYFKTRETLAFLRVFTAAVSAYIQRGGKSRGSTVIADEAALVTNIDAAVVIETALNAKIQTVFFDIVTGTVHSSWRDVRPIPARDTWFESVWHAFEDGSIRTGEGERHE